MQEFPDIFSVTINDHTVDMNLIETHSGMRFYNFDLLGKNKLTKQVAISLINEFKERNPNHKINMIVALESSAVCLASDMSNLMGFESFVCVRKAKRNYMRDPLKEVLCTDGIEPKRVLFLDIDEMGVIKGKNFLFVDDFIITGATRNAVSELILRAGGKVVSTAVLSAMGQKFRNDPCVTSLFHVPVYDEEGKEI